MDKNYPWRCAAFMGAYYSANAIYQGYISKYYQMTGASNTQISLLLAAAPLVSIFAQPVWGALGDRSANRNRVLRIMILMGIALMALLPVSNRMWWMLLLCTLFAGCYTSIQPMGDSIILEALSRQGNQPFGPLRLCGCLSYSVINIGFGYLIGDRFGWVPWSTILMMLLILGSTFMLPATRGHQSESGKKMNLLDVFRIPHMTPLLIMLVVLQLCMGYFYSFFSIHFTSLPGGTVTLLGICYAFSAFGEVWFLLYGDRLYDKFGVGKLMCLSAVVMLVRWIILAACRSMPVILISQLLFSSGFVIMTVSTSKYMNAVVPDELKSSGQLLLAVLGYGIARTAGILGGGILSDALGGTQQAFGVMAGLCVLMLLIFAPKYLRMPPLTGKAEP